MIRSLAVLAVCLAMPAAAESNKPDPHTRVLSVFETACLRGEDDFSDSNVGFLSGGLEQKDAEYWIDPQSVIIGATRVSEGNAQYVCSVGLVQGDFDQFAQALPNVLSTVWDADSMKRFAGSGDRSDIFMTENDIGIRAAWVDISEGNIAVLMTSFTRKEDLIK